VTGPAALVAAANVRGNALTTETEIGIGREITEMIGTEGEGVVPLPLRGDAPPALTGGQPKSVLMTARGPHPLLMI